MTYQDISFPANQGTSVSASGHDAGFPGARWDDAIADTPRTPRAGETVSALRYCIRNHLD